MVKYLLDMLALTAGTVPLWRKSRFPKDALKVFRWMSSWHHQWRTGTPDQILHMDLILHMDQIPQKDQSPHMIIIVLTLLFRRVELRAMNMSIILLIIMFISPRIISLLTHMLILTPLMWNKVDWLLCHLSHMVLAEWWILCHPFRCGWWRKRTNLLCGVRSPDVLKTSEEFAGDLKLPERTQANHDEMNFHFTRPHTDYLIKLFDEIELMILMSYSSLMKYMSL